MKPAALALALLIAALPLAAVEVGDKLDSVLAEKGSPSNRIERGNLVILNYPDSVIRVKDGRVAEVESRSNNSKASSTGSAVSVMPAPKQEPKPQRPAGETIEPGKWTSNYQTALNTAKATGKKVFLLFTGSDWCIWCKRLEGEILSTPEFASYAAENLVLVKLDFPREIPQTEALKAQNQQLAQAYGIQGFPTVILLNNAGKPVGSLGYLKGGPQPFLAELRRY